MKTSSAQEPSVGKLPLKLLPYCLKNCRRKKKEKVHIASSTDGWTDIRAGNLIHSLVDGYNYDKEIMCLGKRKYQTLNHALEKGGSMHVRNTLYPRSHRPRFQ